MPKVLVATNDGEVVKVFDDEDIDQAGAQVEALSALHPFVGGQLLTPRGPATSRSAKHD